MVLDPGRAMNGSFGTLFDEVGQEIAWVNRFEVKDDLNYQEMNVLGTRRTKHKLTSQAGSGTIAGFRVVSDIPAHLTLDPTASYTFVGKLDDPEAYGYERVRIRGVKFNSIPIMQFQAGQVVEQELPFVFDEDPEFLDAVMGTGVALPVTVNFAE